MESKSIVIHKGGKEEKYKLYVEDYVLSYLKYETGSLECSEIYFYGTKQNGERKYIIYGAGRDKQIPVFDTYDLLEEIMCRLTQAGPVFMVREAEEIYQVRGFDIFYQDNQAMQSYMVERQRSFNRPQTAEKRDRHEAAGVSSVQGGSKVETKPAHPHGMMSVQLGAILIILVAIVINSANSYDKMEQLNQSAEEVFFAIENQEADDSVADGYEPEEDIVVERDQNQGESLEDDLVNNQGDDQKNEDEKNVENVEKTDQSENGKPDSDELKDGNVQSTDSENGKEESAGANVEGKDAVDEGNHSETAQMETEIKDTEDQTEALSRNVTRYYKVEKGDTLYTICQKIYGDTSQVNKICELNNISDPDRIRYGQKIILP